jgi:hypothetical protein
LRISLCGSDAKSLNVRKNVQKIYIYLLKRSSFNDSDSRKLFLGEKKYDLISYLIYFGCTICEYMQLKINFIMQMRFKIFGKGLYTNPRHYTLCFYYENISDRHVSPIQACTSPYRPLQACTGPYRPMQAHTGPYRPIQAHTGLCKLVQVLLNH